MTRKTMQPVILVAIFGIGVTLGPKKAMARRPGYSYEQLQFLQAKATNGAAYQKLARHFHCRELLFRMKAQKAIDEYTRSSGRYPMATKTVSRAELAVRTRESYLSKADANAEIAEQYDEMLARLGVKPTSESAWIVSLQDLQNASTAPTGSATRGSPFVRRP